MEVHASRLLGSVHVYLAPGWYWAAAERIVGKYRVDDDNSGRGIGRARGGPHWMVFDENDLVRTGLLVAAGLVLVYPSLLEDVIGLMLFAVAAALQYLHRRSATGRLSAADLDFPNRFRTSGR